MPLLSSLKFFAHFDKFEKVEDIAYPPADINPPLERNHSEHITIGMEAKEVVFEITKVLHSTIGFLTVKRLEAMFLLITA